MVTYRYSQKVEEVRQFLRDNKNDAKLLQSIGEHDQCNTAYALNKLYLYTNILNRLKHIIEQFEGGL